MKIKDNVDLNILVDKYGFYKVGSDYTKNIEFNCDIYVTPNRNIKLRIDAEYEAYVEVNSPNILFDLIADGLVERVVE